MIAFEQSLRIVFAVREMVGQSIEFNDDTAPVIVTEDSQTGKRDDGGFTYVEWLTG